MERIPNRKYPKEFREEAVNLVTEEALSMPDVSWRLDLPKSTETERFMAVRAETLGEIGKQWQQGSNLPAQDPGDGSKRNGSPMDFF